MIFTLYYMAATFLRSWQLRSVYEKISKHVAQKFSVVFYNLPNEVNDILLTPVSSELCMNQSQAVISECLWYNDRQRGCCVSPLQKIHLSPWITFPLTPNVIPFTYNGTNDISLDDENPIFILIETDLNPVSTNLEDIEVMVENFGMPVAWKVDTNIAVLIKSDIHHFVNLLSTTFLQNQFLINDKLPIIRIESVVTDGHAQPFELLINHVKKEFLNRTRPTSLTGEQWNKHLIGLKSLGVLASQATEFAYNKNKTEGKTGIVKPDLISSKNIEDLLLDNIITSPDSPKSIAPISLPTKTSPKLSPLKIDPKISSTPTPSASITIKSSPLKVSTSPAKSSIAAEDVKVPEITTETSSNGTTTVLEPIQTVIAPTPPKETSEAPPTIRPEPTINAKELTQSIDNASTNSKKTTNNEDVKKAANPVKAKSEKDVLKRISRPSLKRTEKHSSMSCKPPNVLVYSDSPITRDNILATLKQILEKDTYTIYSLTALDATTKVWMENTTLLIVCGSVDYKVGKILLDYFLHGGKLLCLCSDLLHIVLNTYRTAEVREHELVQFSYGKWQKVKMMHHIFCYQPSPVKKHFSTDGEEPFATVPKKPSVEVKDLQGYSHNVQVEVLGSEETWNTPSLMLANNIKTSGKAVFSQIHLEADPSLYEAEENNYKILKQNDKFRVEILTDILSSHLGVVVASLATGNASLTYKNAYFLGVHELKVQFLDNIKSSMTTPNVVKNGDLEMHFCGKTDEPPKPSKNILPILVCHCPENFSTLDYFNNLKSEQIGRLVIYAPVITSSMNVISNLKMSHGIVVIPRQQTSGSGRNKNQWLSPEGCLMFSLQLHIPMNSTLGQRIPLVQHLIAVAFVSTILSAPGYEDLDIRLKWPNDIYANGSTKIGGLIVNSIIQSSMAIVNIGCGVNLNNSSPTLCINDLIKEFNTRNNKNLEYLSYEKNLALIFTEIEKLYNKIQTGDLEILYRLYYKYWLHGDTEVSVLSKTGEESLAKIIGIDKYGYLLVKSDGKDPESVHPDGNSFDMLRGLIVPKFN